MYELTWNKQVNTRMLSADSSDTFNQGKGRGAIVRTPLYKFAFIFANFNNQRIGLPNPQEASRAPRAYRNPGECAFSAWRIINAWGLREFLDEHGFLHGHGWTVFKLQTDKFKFTYLSGRNFPDPLWATIDEVPALVKPEAACRKGRMA